MTHTPAPWKVMPAQKGKLGGIEVTTDKPWLIRDLICMMPHGPEQAQARAYADTWKEARETPNYLIKSLLQAHKSDRRINRKLKTDIRKDFDVINSDAQAEKYLYNQG